MSDLRLSTIDDTLRSDHYQLNQADECYFLFEYTAQKNFAFSDTNSLISNIKKKPSRSSENGYHYKARCIQKASEYFRVTINLDWLKDATVVPMPSSKTPGHPDYDPRIRTICEGIEHGLDVRDLLLTRADRLAAHECSPGSRPTVEDLEASFVINGEARNPAPERIALFDDVLTNGSHFRAASNVLNQTFPRVPIVGFFIARTVHEGITFPSIDDLDF